MRFMAILAEDSGLGEQVGMYVLPLIGSVLLAYAIYNLTHDLRRVEGKRVANRLRERSGSMGDSLNELDAKASILRRQKAEGGGLSAALSKLSFMPKLQEFLDQADIPLPAVNFLLYNLGASFVSYIVCYFLKTPMWVSMSIPPAIPVLALTVLLFLRSHRLNKFMNQLPDVFELMSQGLRAGHSLANAILLIAQQLPNPVGKEFARVFHEQNLGIKMEDALKDMARRVGLMDVRFFVTAVLIQRQTGGDLAEVLDNISSVIRDRIKLFGTVKALTAEGRLSGWVLLALPIAVFIMELVINPKYANTLLEDEIGNYLLIAGAVMQFLGLLLIQKIVNIKV